jgi:AcrR family transcriptional regulator
MSVSRIVTRIESPSPECGRSAAARSRQATRGRLPASGVSRFAERGLNAVTSHDVTSHDAAREAGVATGIFYLHLPDGTHPD